MTKKLREYFADVALVSVAIAWGTTFVVVQEAVEHTPVYSFLFLRFGLAFVILLPFFWRFWVHFNLQGVLSGSLLGCVFFGGFATQTYGLTLTQSSIVAFITGLNVIIVPLFLFLIFRQKASMFSIIGAFIASFGLYLLTKTGSVDGFGWGEWLSLFCAAFFALHIVFTGYFSTKHHVICLVASQILTVTILSFIFSLLYDETTIPLHFEGTLISALVVTAVFATAYALLIQTYMQQFTTPAKTAIIFTMEPLSAAVMGYLWAGEVLSFSQIFGGILIIVAMLSAELGTYYRRKS